jgi:hypothetical protein
MTADRRFALYRPGRGGRGGRDAPGGWRIGSVPMPSEDVTSQKLLDRHGLQDVYFSTRRDAAEALAFALMLDQQMEMKDCPGIIICHDEAGWYPEATTAQAQAILRRRAPHPRTRLACAQACEEAVRLIVALERIYREQTNPAP